MKICPIALQNYQNKLKIFQILNEHFQNGQSALTFCQKAKFRQIWSHCTTPPIEEKYKKYFERTVSSNCKKTTSSNWTVFSLQQGIIFLSDKVEQKPKPKILCAKQCLNISILIVCSFWGAIPGLFFFIFVFSVQLTVNIDQYKFLPMTGFKPQTSGIGSDRSTNCATTTAQPLIVCS